jgi:hypothetical protein
MPRSKPVPAEKADRPADPHLNAVAEYEWMARHPKVFEPFAGEYVALYGHRVIAHGKDGAKVIAEADKISPHHLFAYLDDWEEDMILGPRSPTSSYPVGRGGGGHSRRSPLPTGAAFAKNGCLWTRVPTCR